MSVPPNRPKRLASPSEDEADPMSDIPEETRPRTRGRGGRPLTKIRRIAGMDIGPNRDPNPCVASSPPGKYTTGRWQPPPAQDGTDDLDAQESTSDERRLWQDCHGRTYKGIEGRISARQQNRWLASNTRWKYGLDSDWRGEKVLGVGGFGLVGLWEFTNQDGRVNRVVVKQSEGRNRALEAESGFLHVIAETKTRHVVRMLKQYHEEKGQGTSEWDRARHWVSRIYLEYCENGDMGGIIKGLYACYGKEKKPVPEEYIWLVWECLARGLCVLAYGNENLSGPRWLHPEIGHFDIKPNNILVGRKDEQHTLLEVFKIADFGVSSSIPEGPLSADLISRMEGRGTKSWRAPEQTDRKTPNRMVGTPTNVWQIAKCMYELIRLGRRFSTKKYFFCRLPNQNLSFETYGRKILRAEYDVYSDYLRVLLLRCLARDPTVRPSPRYVLSQCQQALKIIKPDLVPPLGIPEDSVVDERGEIGALGWYSSGWSESVDVSSSADDPVGLMGLPHAEPSNGRPDENYVAAADQMDVAEE